MRASLVLVAAGATFGALLLLARPAPVLPGGAQRQRSVRGTALAGAGAVALLAATLSPRSVLLVVLGAGVTAGGAALLRRRRRRRAADAAAGRVLETCELLAAELAAGRPPGAALDRAAGVWEPLGPVARAQHLGSDVPEALRAVAGVPGCADLRLVAAAWQVAHRTGQGLAGTLAGVARGLRAGQTTRRVVEAELASARATARLLAALPVVALAMGSGTGGNPWQFLLTQPLGLACLAGGLAFGFVGLWWIEAIAEGVESGVA
ncbi:type II secretion system F family protein [Nocardioides pacificus]